MNLGEIDVILSIHFDTTKLLRFCRFLLFAVAGFAALPLATLPAEASELQVLSGHVPQAVAISHALHELPRTTQLRLAIGLPLRNEDELDLLIAQLADESSPNFRHYLSAEQFAAKFGPTEQDYQELMQFVRENGLQVTGTHSNRLLLDVSGGVPEIEKTFHVKMMAYQHESRGEFYAPDREPSLDIAVKTLNISGLDNFVVPHPMGLKAVAMKGVGPYVTGSGPGGYFIGKDFRAAYAAGVTLTGSGQVVGLLEFDGFYAGDVQKNFAQAGVPAVPTQTVLLDGFSGAPGSSNIEVTLDIMMASYMAPGLTKVMVYEGIYPNDVLNRMATDNLAQQISSSWGFGINATTEQIFKQYIAQGQSFLQASGDSGAYTGGVMPPSDDPNVTVVGGTSLTTSGAGGAWQSESAWSGSGGGISTTYSIPSYQQGFSMAACGGSIRMRNIPDVALTADIQMYLIQNNGQAVVVGGTSAAAPLWSGFIALANQQSAANAKARVGFLNPLIYAIGNGSNYAVDFNDINRGSNGFSAVTGYDLTTGWGSPAGQHLIYDLTGTSNAASFTLSSSASTLSINQASTGSATLTVTPKNGFTGMVSLSATGMPSGVTAAFSPAATAGKSTVTFTMNTAAVAGTYSITITGASGSLSSATTISVTVVAPSFSLTTSVASLAIPEGSSGSDAISVSGKNGFNGGVSLSVTGMPSGVTAVFSPATATTTSQVTFTVGAAVPGGVYSFTIKGVSGTLSSSTTVGVTVLVPSFSLSASGTNVATPRAGSGSSTISVKGQNGFNGMVSLTATSLPAGVSAQFSPSSTASTSNLSLNASSTAAPGTYTITMIGSSGALSSSTTIGLTVTAPNFALTISPGNLGVPRGSSSAGMATITAQNGFKGSVSLSASGAPSGVTVTFGSVSAGGTAVVTVAASSTATAGSFPLTLTGVSGTLTNSVTLPITVLAPATGTSFVNLSSAYNVNALVVDGAPFTGGGLDGGANGSSTAYSANLVGVQQTIGGSVFYFGPANALDAVSAATIPLPAGKFSGLKLLATGVNGAQPSQSFKVTYTDGTASTFTQSLSDWFTSLSFQGETKAMTMAYRDNAAGVRDVRTFYLYGYVLTLNASKTVASITLPNNRNVVVLAASLIQ
jgi:hypothetical protein